jgi:hypothetical protein
MKLYMSGAPQNDVYQTIENRFCRNRLFSMHPDYAPQVMKWVESVRDGLLTVDDFFQRKPSHREILANRDREKREWLQEQGDGREWVPLEEILRRVCASQTRLYPRQIMLDSGAFTAWKRGEYLSLDQLREYYARFVERDDGLFDQLWLINLDVITDDTMTADDKKDAARRSDDNFRSLRSEFGNRVLPVFHQGEGEARLKEVIEQADDYLCVSPNNKLSEKRRWPWARLVNRALREFGSKARTHGLATSGNVMVRKGGLLSGDSAAWARHGQFGTVDILGMDYEDSTERQSSGPDFCREIIKGAPFFNYKPYYISRERSDFDCKASQDLIGNIKYFSHLPDYEQKYIIDRVERLGFPFVAAQWIDRVRSLVCMAELDGFSGASEPFADEINAEVSEMDYADL